MNTLQHTRNIILTALAFGLLPGCGEMTSDPTSSVVAPEFKNGNGGKPSGDPSTAVEMTLTGAMTGGPAPAAVTTDTKRGYHVDAENMTLDVAFSNTVGTDAALATNCIFSPDPMPEPQRTDLINTLRGVGSIVWGVVHLGADKRDGVGRFVLRQGAPALIQFGGNAGDPPPDVEDLNGNLDQEPSARTEPVVLRYTGGRVRALTRLDQNGQNEATLNCVNLDVVTATIASPAP